MRGVFSTQSPMVAAWRNFRAALPLRLLIAVGCAVFGWQSPAAADPGYSYALDERIYPSNGAIAQVEWLDNSHYLTLALTPGGTEIYRHSYPTTTLPQLFMSASFMRSHICEPGLAGRLTWQLSPRKQYLFFSWFNDDGRNQWKLFDIANAPHFQLKNFQPPPGMFISRVLFSPDDRFAVFVHDSLHGESDVSVLVLDLESGNEQWRLSTQQVNFISELWWSGAIYDTPRFYAAAKLFNGQFEPHHGLAFFDIGTQTLEFTPQEYGVICGDQALWGKLFCYATSDPMVPYVLAADIPGQELQRQVPLTAQPVRLEALPAPGLALLSNTEDWITNQLWLIDLFNGEKYLVDDDCAGFALSADGKLLVWARTRIELRVYAPVVAE